MPGYSARHISQSLVLVMIALAGVLVLVAALRWWRLAGFTHPREWRDLHLLPAASSPAPGTACRGGPRGSVRRAGDAARRVPRDSLLRGGYVARCPARPVEAHRHLASSPPVLSAVRDRAPRKLAAARALLHRLGPSFGAAVQGIGLAAQRLRTNTIWPLIALHALGDLVLQIDDLPIAMIEPPSIPPWRSTRHPAPTPHATRNPNRRHAPTRHQRAGRQLESPPKRGGQRPAHSSQLGSP